MAQKDDQQAEKTQKSKRGFAAMSPERRREIAAKGGAAVPPEKRSFSKSRDLAAKAGRSGGSAPTRARATDKG
jgi:uncharacterized protein